MSVTILLLKTALSLLLLVQGNPNVDPALREQAITIANQAIKTATEDEAKRQSAVPTYLKRPVIESVNGKGGFGTGDNNYVLGKYFTTSKNVYLQSNHGKKIYLDYVPVDDTKLSDVRVPDWIERDTYDLYVENKAGRSAPYSVGNIGTSEKGGAIITVVYPNGGEILDNSGAKDSGLIGYITWVTSDIGEAQNLPVTISIAKEGVDHVYKRIARNIPNTGIYAWKYDASIPDGKYRISLYVGDDKNPTAIDASDESFTLTGNATKSSLVLTSPNGGETYQTRNAIPYSWYQNYTNGILELSLTDYATGKEYYHASLNGFRGPGTYSEQMPTEASNVPTGHYKITICDKNKTVASRPLCDSGDSYFTITNDSNVSVDLKVKDPYNTGYAYNWVDAYVDGPIAILSGAGISLQLKTTGNLQSCVLLQNSRLIALTTGSSVRWVSDITTDTTFKVQCTGSDGRTVEDNAQVNIKG